MITRREQEARTIRTELDMKWDGRHKQIFSFVILAWDGGRQCWIASTCFYE